VKNKEETLTNETSKAICYHFLVVSLVAKIPTLFNPVFLLILSKAGVL